MPEKRRRATPVPQHRHCKVCGRAIPPDQEFCSSQCKEDEERRERRAKRMTRIYFIIVFLLMALLILFTILTTPP